MPQEIDGKGSENLPLCRNRDIPRSTGQMDSVGMPAGELGLNRAAMHRPTDTTST